MKQPETAMQEIEAWGRSGGLAPTSEVTKMTGYSSQYLNELCQTGVLSALKGKCRNSRWMIQRWSVYQFCKNELVESGS